MLVTSSQAAEIASTYAHCRTHQMPLAVTATGSLYSQDEQSLTIASHVVCHIPRQDQEQVYHFKAKSTDQGQAFQHLVQACGRTLTLTGGKSTSIFWLLYRLDRQARNDFTFHDERLEPLPQELLCVQLALL